MNSRRARVLTASAVAIALVATPVLWTPMAFANGESRSAVLTTWLVVPILPLVGAWVARNRPENPVGWLLLTVGVAQTVGMLHGQVVDHATANGWSDPAVGWLLWSGEAL